MEGNTKSKRKTKTKNPKPQEPATLPAQTEPKEPIVSKSAEVQTIPSVVNGEANPKQFEGAIHLAFIVLGIYLVRSAYVQATTANLMALVKTSAWNCVLHDGVRLVLFDAIEGLSTLVIYQLYKLFALGTISKSLLWVVYALFQVSFLLFFAWLKFNMAPLVAMISIMRTFVYVLKMHSYVAVNLRLHDNLDKKRQGKQQPGKEAECQSFTERRATRQADESKSELNTNSNLTSTSSYPNNVTLRDYSYFIFGAPTLVYETGYLRTASISWWYIAKEMVAIVFCALGILYMFSQFVLPVLEAQTEDSISQMLSDSMAVCVACLGTWLLGFYGFFHCWLNLKSELFRFGNREFYQDWWNAKTLAEFWRKWNLPVPFPSPDSILAILS